MNPISYPIKTLLAPSPDYRWGEHLCLLAPLGAIMAFVILCLGWWGEPVRQFFSPLATADIHITRFMSVVTHIGNPLIYVFYLVLLLVALTKRDWRETMFVLRCVLFSVFFLCFVMQIMKYGLGMPRPGFPWPPYVPFRLYQSICFVPFKAYGDYHHRSRASGTLVQKPSFFPFPLGSNRAHGFFPSVVGAASPHRYCWRNAFREYCRQVHCLRAAPDGKRRAAGAWRTKNTRRNG